VARGHAQGATSRCSRKTAARSRQAIRFCFRACEICGHPGPPLLFLAETGVSAGPLHVTRLDEYCYKAGRWQKGCCSCSQHRPELANPRSSRGSGRCSRTWCILSRVRRDPPEPAKSMAFTTASSVPSNSGA